MTPFKSLALPALLLASLSLSACATDQASVKTATPDPKLPTEQFPLEAQSKTQAFNLRINPNGLSDNQKSALNQVAEKASWSAGDPADIDIITSPDPAAIAAGQRIAVYLMGKDVASQSLTQKSLDGQPADIVTVNLVAYRARTYDCNESWENLSATRNNLPYANYGCAVNANLAAQIADPRDLDRASPATPPDAARKSVILDKYRKGEVTGSATDDASKGTISEAVK